MSETHAHIGDVPREGRSVVRTIYLVFLLGLCATHPAIEDPVAFVVCLTSVGGILFPWLTKRWWYWGTITLALASNLLVTYAQSANHYWLTMYVTAYVAVDALLEERQLPDNPAIARGLLAVVFGFAFINKLRMHFLGGMLLGTYFLEQNSLSNVLPLLMPDYDDVTAHFDEAFDDVADEALLGVPVHPLDVPDWFVAFCQAMAVSVVILEGGVFLAMLTPVFHRWYFPLAVLAFTWGTALMRHEFFFFTLLCILTLLAKPAMETRWRIAFFVSIAVFLAMGISELDVEL